ncbi:MAG TPA: hypothetical protein VGG39_10265 [Polyangiaceae bacterium]
MGASNSNCIFAGFAALLASLGAACSTPPPPPLVVKVLVESDPGVPVTGATVQSGGRVVGTTGPTGATELTLRGEEGQSFDLTVQCPDGYKSPFTPVTVALRRLADPSKVPVYEVSCPPTTRTVVVAIAADRGPNLPVLYLGREVARTDASGAADVLLRVTPGEQVSLTIATTEKGAEALRPQSPVATFNVKDQDDVFVFATRFSVEAKRAPRVFAAPKGPTRI